MNLLEKLWSLLPDKCEIPKMHTYITCDRMGIRGNENIIVLDGKAITICDNCHSKLKSKLNMPL